MALLQSVRQRRLTHYIAFALLLVLTGQKSANALVVEATADTWIRQSAPSTPYDSDLISVWAFSEEDGARVGVATFDLSATVGLDIESVYLALFDPDDSRSTNSPISQQAYIFGTTPPDIEEYTWEEYETFDLASETAFNSLGSYDIPEGDVRDGYDASALATATDIALLEQVRDSQSNIVTLTFKASEGARDWDDIESGGAPRLVFNEPITLFGDLNNDGVIDLSDYAVLTAADTWLQEVEGAAADLNSDGFVGLVDFGLFKTEYLAANPGSSLPFGGAVPEPTSIALGCIGLVLVCFRASRRRTNK